MGAQAQALLEELDQLAPGIRLGIQDKADLENPVARDALRRFVERVRANPLLGYEPHSKQLAFHAARKKVKVFLGGNRSGKSVAGIVDDLIQALDERVVPPALRPLKIWQPPFRCRIVVPDFGRPMAAVLETLRQWTPASELRGGSWEEAWSSRDHQLYFANGSFIEVMTCEQDVSKFGGVTRERVHYDEEPKGEKGQAIYFENTQRIAEVRGDELFTFSPVHDLGWTYDDLWETKGPEVAKEVWESDAMILVRAGQADNPHLDKHGVEEALAKLPEHERLRRSKGEFIHAQGLVYPDFDRDLHTCPKLDPEFVKGLEQFDCIDPGLNTAVLFAGFDSDNVLWVYDELHLRDNNAIPENAAELIRAKRKAWGVGPSPKVTLIDPAGAARSHQTNEKTFDAYKRAGIRTKPAQNDLELGVLEIMRRLDHRNGERNPQPLVQIGLNCDGLLWELGRYRKDIREDGKFGVVKKDDHKVDCLRYLGLARPLPRRTRPLHARQVWVPGTAPPLDRKPRQVSGPYGKYS